MLINEAVLHILDKIQETYSYHRPRCNWAIHFSLNTLQNSWIKSKSRPAYRSISSANHFLDIW